MFPLSRIHFVPKIFFGIDQGSSPEVTPSQNPKSAELSIEQKAERDKFYASAREMVWAMNVFRAQNQEDKVERLNVIFQALKGALTNTNITLSNTIESVDPGKQQIPIVENASPTSENIKRAEAILQKVESSQDGLKKAAQDLKAAQDASAQANAEHLKAEKELEKTMDKLWEALTSKMGSENGDTILEYTFDCLSPDEMEIAKLSASTDNKELSDKQALIIAKAYTNFFTKIVGEIIDSRDQNPKLDAEINTYLSSKGRQGEEITPKLLSELKKDTDFIQIFIADPDKIGTYTKPGAGLALSMPHIVDYAKGFAQYYSDKLKTIGTGMQSGQKADEVSRARENFRQSEITYQNTVREAIGQPIFNSNGAQVAAKENPWIAPAGSVTGGDFSSRFSEIPIGVPQRLEGYTDSAGQKIECLVMKTSNETLKLHFPPETDIVLTGKDQKDVLVMKEKVMNIRTYPILSSFVTTRFLFNKAIQDFAAKNSGQSWYDTDQRFDQYMLELIYQEKIDIIDITKRKNVLATDTGEVERSKQRLYKEGLMSQSTGTMNPHIIDTIFDREDARSELNKI